MRSPRTPKLPTVEGLLPEQSRMLYLLAEASGPILSKELGERIGLVDEPGKRAARNRAWHMVTELRMAGLIEDACYVARKGFAVRLSLKGWSLLGLQETKPAPPDVETEERERPADPLGIEEVFAPPGLAAITGLVMLDHAREDCGPCLGFGYTLEGQNTDLHRVPCPHCARPALVARYGPLIEAGRSLYRRAA